MSSETPGTVASSPPKTPVLALAASFSLGILLAHNASAHAAVTALSVIAAAFCLLAGLIILRLRWLRLAALVAALGFVAAGAAASSLFESRF